MEIWLVDLGRSLAALEACEAAEPRLSDQDVHRFSDIRDRGHRQQRRAAAIALRLLLARVAGDGRFDRVAFTQQPTGKPELPSDLLTHGEIAFSLSHAQDLGLIAVSRSGPIGVDIEGQRQLHMSPARRQAIVAAAARVAIEATFGDAAEDCNVLRAWVCLEAYAKARGCGIGQVLTDAGVLSPSVGAQRAASSAGVAWPPREGLAVCGLALPGGHGEQGPWFAAVAAPAAMVAVMAPVRMFPQTASGLAALVTGPA